MNESELDTDDDCQRSFTSCDEIDEIVARSVSSKRISGRVLANSGMGRLDLFSRFENSGTRLHEKSTYRRDVLRRRSTADKSRPRSVGNNAIECHEPPMSRAVKKRMRSGGSFRDHSPNGCEFAAGWIERE